MRSGSLLQDNGADAVSGSGHNIVRDLILRILLAVADENGGSVGIFDPVMSHLACSRPQKRNAGTQDSPLARVGTSIALDPNPLSNSIDAVCHDAVLPVSFATIPANGNPSAVFYVDSILAVPAAGIPLDQSAGGMPDRYGVFPCRSKPVVAYLEPPDTSHQVHTPMLQSFRVGNEGVVEDEQAFDSPAHRVGVKSG